MKSGVSTVKHLKILRKGEKIASLFDAQCLKQLILDLIEAVGMTPLGEPQIHDVELDVRKLGREPFEDEGGTSVLACLSTSHVALHVWPLRGEFHLDIYSCREYRPGPALDVIKSFCGAGGELQAFDLSFACELKPPPQMTACPGPELQTTITP